MPKRCCRNHNIRHIKQSKAYTVDEICKMLGVHSGTVYQWFKRGLIPIEGSYPKLVHGSELIVFLQREKAARKIKCQHDEFYCCTCKAATKLKAQSVEVKSISKKGVSLAGICDVCGTKVNQTVTAEKHKKIIILAQVPQVHLTGLVGSNQSTSNTKTNEVRND